MAPSNTKSSKGKGSGSKSGAGGKSGSGARSSSAGVSKPSKPKGPSKAQQVKEKNILAMFKKSKKKTYTDAELGIPTLNMITPVGVVKPKGKKKGKVFVDDKESMSTILSIVQAEKDGQIESKMIKARQMEEIREARRIESEKKEQEKKDRLEDTKQSLRKKRKRKGEDDEDGDTVKSYASVGSKATKPKSSKKRVSFA